LNEIKNKTENLSIKNKKNLESLDTKKIKSSLMDLEQNVKEKEKKETEKPIQLETRNQELEGKRHPETNVEYKRRKIKIDGKFYEGVFPVFDSKFDVHLPKHKIKVRESEQFKYCTKKLAEKIQTDPEFAKQFDERQKQAILAGKEKIPGLTWHHNEKTGLMQLVDEDIHKKTGHTGGNSLWGTGY